MINQQQARKRERYFQWIAGELSGTIEVLDYITEEDGEFFYNFKSGETCNLRFINKFTKNPADIKDKFMVEIVSPNDPWISETIGTKKVQVMDTTYGETAVDAPPLEDIIGASGSGANLNVDSSKLGSTKFKAPKYNGPAFDLPNFDDYVKLHVVSEVTPEKSTEQSDVSTAVNSTNIKNTVVSEDKNASHAKDTPKISTVSETDPVRILAKTCKKHPTEINLSLNINLPSKSIYNIAESEFDNGGKNFVDCLVESININEIVENLSKAIHDAYTEDESETKSASTPDIYIDNIINVHS